MLIKETNENSKKPIFKNKDPDIIWKQISRKKLIMYDQENQMQNNFLDEIRYDSEEIQFVQNTQDFSFPKYLNNSSKFYSDNCKEKCKQKIFDKNINPSALNSNNIYEMNNNIYDTNNNQRNLSKNIYESNRNISTNIYDTNNNQRNLSKNIYESNRNISTNIYDTNNQRNTSSNIYESSKNHKNTSTNLYESSKNQRNIYDTNKNQRNIFPNWYFEKYKNIENLQSNNYLFPFFKFDNSLIKTSEIFSEHLKTVDEEFYKNNFETFEVQNTNLSKYKKNGINNFSMQLSDYKIDVESINRSEDTRKTCMIKNIPNKYTQKMLIDLLNEDHYGTFDFVYLRMDFRNKCNVGYAFVNFIDYKTIPSFYNKINGKGWKKFSSNKIAELTYASIQGLENLVIKFRKSSIMNEVESFRPKLFHSCGPFKGQEKKSFDGE
ncbi:RNA recognition motif-containing protein [Hamiltosporidium magnivora]|uniref:RNA recognition motif-containing protein n=1 Tax=Hamiltosporidium magnivora TaxID=148818 RepID=A0A4Q9L3U9_9MICR|nr:RNA recognition motif-containing protein [Hamiltosporidium magnivora]